MVNYKLQRLAMYSYEIENILKHNKRFRGVYSLNNIPLISNGDLVINLDTSNNNGSHWVAMKITDYELFYFDSLKLPMNILLTNYISHLNKTHLYINRDTFQKHLEVNCGEFVVLFLSFPHLIKFNKIY